jgi:SapC protein
MSEMTKLVPISRDVHAQRSWQRVPSYSFVSREPVVPLTINEISLAARTMPLAFVKQGENFVFVAVMGLAETNLMVSPEGSWVGGYIPASLRTYPFRLARSEGEERFLLCFDSDSGLIRDSVDQGERFLNSDGTLGPLTQQIFDILLQFQQYSVPTDLATKALQDAGVIEPWPVQVNSDQGPRAVGGLYRVSEKALSALSDEAFLKFRKNAALSMAYAQMLSMHNLASLDQLQRLHQKHNQVQQSLQNLPSELMLDSVSNEIVFDADTLNALRK